MVSLFASTAVDRGLKDTVGSNQRQCNWYSLLLRECD